MPEQSPLIAHLDDNPLHVALAQLFLAEQGYRTVYCFQGRVARDLIQHQHPDLVLLDMQMEQRENGFRQYPGDTLFCRWAVFSRSTLNTFVHCMPRAPNNRLR